MKHSTGIFESLIRCGLPILVVIVPLLALFPLCGYDFISFDDPVNVYDNDFVVHFSWANLVFFWRGAYEYLYIPLTYNFWGITAKISQLIHPESPSLDPHLFHGLNLLVHLLGTAVLYRILLKLFNDKWGAAAGALLFAVHPVQVEAVAWVTGFKDVLSTFWCLLALWLYLHYNDEKSAGRQRWQLYAAASLAYLCALLSKPTAVILPLVVGVVGWTMLQKSRRQLSLELLPWMALVLPIILVTSSLQDGRELTFIPSYWQRLLVAGDALSFYLYKVFLPITQGADYGRIPQYVLEQNSIYLTGLLPYGALLLLVFRCHRPQLLAGFGLFLLPLLPVLGFVPFNFQNVSTVADRYLYFAMIGPAFLLAWLLSGFKSRIFGGIVIIVLSLLVIKTALAVTSWKNTDTYYRQALVVNPRSWNALMNIGIRKVGEGQTLAALENFKKALEIKGDLATAYFGLGATYENMGNLAAAVASYQRAVELDPQYDLANDKLGLIYFEHGKFEEAIGYLKRAIAVDPTSIRSARYYADLGMVYAQGGNTDMAVEEYRKAVAINPYLSGVHSVLGDIYLGRGLTADARKMYGNDLEIDPKNSLAYNGLGKVYALSGQREEALGAWRRALELDPNSGEVNYNLAELYRELKQYGIASSYAAKAMALGYTRHNER